jgi:hypothetical protein
LCYWNICHENIFLEGIGHTVQNFLGSRASEAGPMRVRNGFGCVL